ncbi:MAG: hypothetical protein MUC35_05990 [Candidatus Margulisbacteria bacterium]|jgi:ABC-type transport system involved in cytochrome bd biosynthesis fused ATPase/permease subunit|nr:hypothetical protein [Candidatus Margulisiibacteriota bacterium]
MFDYLAQNFNLVSFSLALSFLLIVSAIGRVLTGYVALAAARRRTKAAQAHLEQVQQKMRSQLTDLKTALREQRDKK